MNFIWVVDYLIKGDGDDATGYCTAVEAGDIGMALIVADRWIREKHPDEEMMITDIGLDDECLRDKIGTQWRDLLMRDNVWPGGKVKV